MNTQSASLYETDLELVTNILNDAKRSFALLYQKYYNKVLNKCVRITKCKDLAEDLSQDIFVKLYLQLHKFDRKSSFSTWLYAIVNNYCIDYLRKQKNKLTFSVIEDSLMNRSAENDTEPVHFLDNDIHKLMKVLSEEEQNLLKWKYLDKFSIKEIQEKTQLTESAIKMRLKRAKEKVAKNNNFY